MDIKSLQKQNERKNACKTTKADRKKKFQRFKDVLHKNFGPTTINGLGEGKPNICDGCNERVYHLKCQFIKGVLVHCCDYCNPEEVADRKLQK